MSVRLSPTDVRTCEACWREPVTAVRRTLRGRDLLCRACAEGGCPRRVDVFPPYGIYRLHPPENLNTAKEQRR
ncbi:MULTISPECIES: hypothetical protein [Streptomyces]|uniref:hypothetical protein n=1 Tax=Streptomyces TaxID=1883 RepID=UPI0008239049|nr:hypothetical protein YUWDRAFT_03323 [Streptomyces sp. AmelKG-D3]